MSAAPADGGTRQGFVFILFSFGVFRPPSPQLCSERPPHTLSLGLVLPEPLRCSLGFGGSVVTGRGGCGSSVTSAEPGWCVGDCGLRFAVCWCMGSPQKQQPKDTHCVCLFVPQTIEFDESAGAVLRIQPLRTPRDENIYECVAQNPHGEVTVHAKLTVLRGKEPGQWPSAGWEGS